jgi:L-lysine 2,3-aminomutase
MTERAIQKDFICTREFLNEEMSVLRILFDDRDDRIEAMQLIRIHSRVLIFFQTQFETHVVIQLARDQRIISITISLMHVYEQTKVR